jgi:hypothetical protein
LPIAGARLLNRVTHSKGWRFAGGDLLKVCDSVARKERMRVGVDKTRHHYVPAHVIFFERPKSRSRVGNVGRRLGVRTRSSDDAVLHQQRCVLYDPEVGRVNARLCSSCGRKRCERQ